MHVKWRHYWAALGYVVTSGFGVLPVLWDVPVIGAIAASVAGVAVVAVGHHEAQHHPLFRQWTVAARKRVSRLLGTAAGAHVLWVLAFQQAPQAWPGWLAVLLAISGTEVGLAAAVNYLVRREQDRLAEAQQQTTAQAPNTPEPVTVATAAEPPEAAGDEYERVLRVGKAIFRRAQLAALEVDGWRNLNGNGVAYEVQVPDLQSQSNRKKQQIESLSTGENGEKIAIAARRQLGQSIESSWVQVQKERGAGMYTITVLTRDALADVIPYVDNPNAAPSFKDDVRIGWRPDGTEMTERLDQNWFVVGKSQSGKSTFEHRAFAHITAAHNAVLWVCGTEKVYDLVADWVEPYEGTGIPCPINRIAYGPQDTAKMLAAGLRVARDRQNQRKSDRLGWKAIFIELDEASSALNHEEAWARIDGKRRHASALYADLAKAGKSGWVFLRRATQRGVHDSAGTHGGDVHTNTDVTIVFKTNDGQEIGRATEDYKADQPPHPGCFWRKLPGGSPEMGKGEYIQETDVSKDQQHDDATIQDIAWSRRHHDNELDDRAKRAAGYQSRQYVDGEYMAYIRPATTADDEDLVGGVDGEGTSDDEEDASPEAAGREEAKRALASVPGLAAMLGDAADQLPEPDEGEDLDGEGEEGAWVPDPTVLQQRRSRSERIVRIAQDASEPLTRGEFLTALREAGDEPSEQVVQNALGKLVKAGELVRDNGTYAVPDMAPAQ